MDPMTLSASIVAAAIANMSFACTVGVCLAALMLHDAPPLVRHRLRPLAIAGIGTLIVADTAILALESALMSGSEPVAAFALLVPVLAHSHYGATWFAGIVALIVWMGLLAGSRDFGRPARTGVALCAAAVFAFSRAASSHAADAGDFSLPEWIHWAHLCATASWAGLVIASGLSVLPMLRIDSTGEVLATFAGRLSRAALIAVSVVLVSGIYNADRGLGDSLLPLARSGWGIVLDAKLVLVGVAVVLGAINRLLYLPHVRCRAHRGAANSFTAILKVEAITLLGVLCAAALLAHSVPGADMGAGS